MMPVNVRFYSILRHPTAMAWLQFLKSHAGMVSRVLNIRQVTQMTIPVLRMLPLLPVSVQLHSIQPTRKPTISCSALFPIPRRCSKQAAAA